MFNKLIHYTALIKPYFFSNLTLQYSDNNLYGEFGLEQRNQLKVNMQTFGAMWHFTISIPQP